jgi:putative toxin-antitoxin system antitoxin component (TIGR02293 family)
MTTEELRSLAYAEAVEMFEGDRGAADRWLSSPARGLGSCTPDLLIGTKEGIEKVRTLIGKLERGVLP